MNGLHLTGIGLLIVLLTGILFYNTERYTCLNRAEAMGYNNAEWLVFGGCVLVPRRHKDE